LNFISIVKKVVECLINAVCPQDNVKNGANGNFRQAFEPNLKKKTVLESAHKASIFYFLFIYRI